MTTLENQDYKKKIEELLYQHGTLSIIFYRSSELLVIHKYGLYEDLLKSYETLVGRFKLVGFNNELESTTLMELPKDAEEIFKIIHCGGLEVFLKKNNINI